MFESPKANLNFARSISVALSPLIMVLVFVFAFLYPSFPKFGIEWGMVITIYILVILPIYATLISRNFPKLRIGDDPSRQDRNSLYLSLSIAALLNIALFANQNVYSVIVSLNLILFVFWGVFFLVNYMIDKISMHTGMFSFVIIFMGGSNPVWFVALLFLPILSWSRIVLHKHTWFQLVFGGIVGAFLGMLGWML